MRVAFAYPGVSIHSRQLATALLEDGSLAAQFTTMGWISGSWTEQWLRPVISRTAPQLQSYVWSPAFRDVLRTFPNWEYVRQAARRLVGSVLEDRVWEFASDAYDRWVANNLRPEWDAIIGYEYSCRRTFERAKKLGITTIADVVSPLVRDDMFVSDTEVEADPYLTRIRAKAVVRANHKVREYAATDFFLANSRLTGDSVASAGIDPARIAVVPLGAPAICEKWRETKRQGGIKFLFVGRLSTRKGVHILFPSWQAAELNGSELWLAGSWGVTPREEWRKLSGVRELGQLDRETLGRAYLEADVLLLPTLCDGFGLVVTEALASGLPVITTDQAGAAEMITHGVNGWVVPAGDTRQLSSLISTLATNPNQVRSMRHAAEASATLRPWQVFRREAVAHVRKFVENRK